MGRVIGGQLIEIDRTESTNKLAAELVELAKVQHGAVILAHEQTMGRGQRGRSWSSVPERDLTFSIVLRPTALRVENQFALAKVAALAVHDTLAGWLPTELRIKWPNDILVGSRKVAGILIKNEVVGTLVLGSIVGVGLNVNSREFPADAMATSLCLEAGREFERRMVLEALLAHFERRWDQMEQGATELSTDYTDRLWCRGRWTVVGIDGHERLVRPIDVDVHGRLLVEQEGGGVNAFGMDRLRFAPR